MCSAVLMEISSHNACCSLQGSTPQAGHTVPDLPMLAGEGTTPELKDTPHVTWLTPKYFITLRSYHSSQKYLQLYTTPIPIINIF